MGVVEAADGDENPMIPMTDVISAERGDIMPTIVLVPQGHQGAMIEGHLDTQGGWIVSTVYSG